MTSRREELENFAGIATEVYFQNNGKLLTEIIYNLHKKVSEDKSLNDCGHDECTLAIMQIDAVVGSEYWGIE